MRRAGRGAQPFDLEKRKPAFREGGWLSLFGTQTSAGLVWSFGGTVRRVLPPPTMWKLPNSARRRNRFAQVLPLRGDFEIMIWTQVQNGRTNMTI